MPRKEPLYPHISKSRRQSTEYQYLGNWKPSDRAIYSDFGLRSLYIVEVMDWGTKPERFTEEGVTHDRGMGSVKAKVIDTSLVDWDMTLQRIPPGGEVGSIHYYDYTNLYRSIYDLVDKEARVLRPDILHRLMKDLKKPDRWKVLEKYHFTEGV